MYIALGSVAELETQLTIAKNLQFITVVEFEKSEKQINQIGMMLSGLIKYRKTQ